MNSHLSSEEITENSLALLDDIHNGEAQARLDRFAALEAWIDSSLEKLAPKPTAMNPPAGVTVLAPLSNAPPLESQATITVAQEFLASAGAPESGEPQRQLIDPQQIVSTNNLSQRSSKQKIQNETLIKALQELRARMNDSKLRSGKITSPQN